MTVVKLSCSGVEVLAAVEGILTAGAVGIKTYIEYTDDEWYGLVKDVAFRIGSTGKSYGMMNVEDVTTVPHESLVAGKHLYIGITGFNVDKSVVIPTMWADCGVVQASAIGDYENSVPPTPTEMEQMVATVKAAQTDVTTKSSQVSKDAKEVSENTKHVDEVKNKIDTTATEIDRLAKETKQAATNAANSEEEAGKSAKIASDSAEVARTAMNSMVYPSFEFSEDGELLIINSELLGTTDFVLNYETGDLEVHI